MKYHEKLKESVLRTKLSQQKIVAKVGINRHHFLMKAVSIVIYSFSEIKDITVVIFTSS